MILLMFGFSCFNLISKPCWKICMCTICRKIGILIPQESKCSVRYPNSVTEDQIEEMRNRTYLIEDTVIRKSLDIMLRRVVYRRK